MGMLKDFLFVINVCPNPDKHVNIDYILDNYTLIQLSNLNPHLRPC